MKIIDLKADNTKAIKQCAELLVESFRDNWPDAWPTSEDALEEVQASLAEDRLSRIAIDDAGDVLGWIGAIEQYDGKVWELHPLAVSPQHRRKGIGRALVDDLESCVKRRGGITLWLGTDDENNQTTLGGIDLYPNVLERVMNIRKLRNHPFEFYQKLGFVITGVMPDANGWGKPDIFMAKRVG